MSRGEISRRLVCFWRDAARDLTFVAGTEWVRDEGLPMIRNAARRELRRRHINYEVQP